MEVCCVEPKERMEERWEGKARRECIVKRNSARSQTAMEKEEEEERKEEGRGKIRREELSQIRSGRRKEEGKEICSSHPSSKM